DNLFLLELFHGPTLAFKDFALQFLGRLMDRTLAERGRRATILGATSGDTGAAALDAFAQGERADVFILFPLGRVSDVQRRQMTTVPSGNVHAIAIEGNFDDCQDLVKAMFADTRFRAALNLTAVNSINWARIMAQVVYYVAAAAALGAAVVRLRQDGLGLEDRQRLRETARLLGRLYQLIGCDGLRPAAMAGLCRWAGVQVLGDVAGPCHPARVLGDLLAMQEHAGRPAAQITLGLAQERRSRVGRTWGRVAALTGLRLAPLRTAAGGRALPACDYVLGPRPFDAPVLPSSLFALGVPGAARAGRPPGDELGPLQADARHRVLQSLLSSL
ncbi:MAG: hypothetical protein KGL50_09970, partial [Burkholderiales bacterium]|nr:hypothetical protein [Burkholderiales bacterium]